MPACGYPVEDMTDDCVESGSEDLSVYVPAEGRSSAEGFHERRVPAGTSMVREPPAVALRTCIASAEGFIVADGQLTSSGKRPAIPSPVKFATQPSGLLNRRIAVKEGFGPMSNQWRVFAGTEMRSSFSHSIE